MPEQIDQEEALKLLREYVSKQKNQRTAAMYLDIAPAYLSDILAGKRDISDYVARGIGYTRRIMYEKVESE